MHNSSTRPSRAAAAATLRYAVQEAIHTDWRQILFVTCAMTIGSAGLVTLCGLYAVIAGYMTHAFQTHLRYSGISLAYQLICAIAGGTTPIISTMLVPQFAGQWLPLAKLLSLLAGLSLLGVCGLARLREDTMAQPQPTL